MLGNKMTVAVEQVELPQGTGCMNIPFRLICA